MSKENTTHHPSSRGARYGENIGTFVAQKLPEYNLTIDTPAKSSGIWFFDIAPGSEEREQIVVQWQAKKGFGISKISLDPDDSYFGTTPNQIFNNLKS